MTTSEMIFPVIEQIDSSKAKVENSNDKLLNTFFPKGVEYLGKLINLANRFSSRCSSWLTMFMFSICIQSRLRSKHLAFYAKGKRTQLRQGANRYNVYTYGQGPKVLLVHGWTSKGAYWIDYVERLVNQGFTAVVMDAPAHGTSKGIRLSVPDFVLCVQKVIDHYDNWHGLVTHSMGSIITTMAWNRSRHRNEKIKLVWMNTFSNCDALITRFARCIGVCEQAIRDTRSWITSWTYEPLTYFSLLDHATEMNTDIMYVYDADDIVVPKYEIDQILSSPLSMEVRAYSGLGHNLRSADVLDQITQHLI